ncbi:hypothetical protein C8R45DRAFT_1156563 [Mycena sanguinolenta]|nr:hypothetical protein C8R45DRAFT_1156563 [Mycena sanguinolenta]
MPQYYPHTSILDKHNKALDRLIADCTNVTVEEIAQSFRKLSELKMQELQKLQISGDLNTHKGKLTGGKGVDGGKSDRTGGNGGLVFFGVDGCMQRTNTVQGGIGGDGGEGGVEGGTGGVGQAPKITKQLIMSGVEGKAYHGPTLSVGEFCQNYHVSENICKLLEEEGFETVGALWEVSDADLRGAELKGGQIAELKRALRDLVTAPSSKSQRG